ncbi:hypothetical protein Goari_015089, partial [Gossypium aridum]|nr:hypothetical protein [Gossypium aridum]
YLVTNFQIVPRGTEGAVSVEGTVAGLLASILLATIGCLLGEINVPEVLICVIASQIANLGESIIGAAFQGKEGFRWLNNDAVNVINISIGCILASSSTLQSTYCNVGKEKKKKKEKVFNVMQEMSTKVQQL